MQSKQHQHRHFHTKFCVCVCLSSSVRSMNQHSLKIDKLNCELEPSWLLKVMLLKSVVSSSKRLSHSRTALPAACDSRMTVLNFCSILNEWCSYLNGSQFIQILEEDIGFILRKGPPFWERNCINPVKKAGPHVPQRYPNAVSQTVKSVASFSSPKQERLSTGKVLKVLATS